MAIKLPVKAERGRMLVDVDGDTVCHFWGWTDEERAARAAEAEAAINAYPTLLARVEELEGALAEMVAASDPDAYDDDEAGLDRCLRAIKAARAALSRKTGGGT